MLFGYIHLNIGYTTTHTQITHTHEYSVLGIIKNKVRYVRNACKQENIIMQVDFDWTSYRMLQEEKWWWCRMRFIG